MKIATPKHWSKMKVKYLVSMQSGNAIESDAIAPAGEFPVYGGNGLRGYTNEFTHEGERILIGRQGALCGNVNYASGKFWATEHAIVATPRAEFIAQWLGESLAEQSCCMLVGKLIISTNRWGATVAGYCDMSWIHLNAMQSCKPGWMKLINLLIATIFKLQKKRFVHYVVALGTTKNSLERQRQ